MSYIRAEIILPKEILSLIQEYADGQYLYIPRKAENHKSWGDKTNSKQFLNNRDNEIYNKYISGIRTKELADTYFLSQKSIQRIILKEKRNK